MLPDTAKLERDLGEGVALYDVVDFLHSERKPGRQLEDIQHILVHHSGAEGAAGMEGVHNHVDYVTRVRGFKGPSYPFWISRKPDVDKEGRVVVYRMGPDTHTMAHTKNLNGKGSAIAFQGNMNETPPSPIQYHMGRALLYYLLEIYPGLTMKSWLWTHSAADQLGGKKKATCPGKDLVNWTTVLLNTLV